MKSVFPLILALLLMAPPLALRAEIIPLKWGQIKGEIGFYNHQTTGFSGEEVPLGPAGFAFLPNGSVAVSDTFNHRVAVFDQKGTFQRELAVGEHQLDYPGDITVDSEGNLFLIDEGAHPALVVFAASPQGPVFSQHITSIEGKVLVQPVQVAAHGGIALVGERATHEILVIKYSGTFLARIPWNLNPFGLASKGELALFEYGDEKGYRLSLRPLPTLQSPKLPEPTKIIEIGHGKSTQGAIIGEMSGGNWMISFIDDNKPGNYEFIIIDDQGKPLGEPVSLPWLNPDRRRAVADSHGDHHFFRGDPTKAPEGPLAIIPIPHSTRK